MRLQLSNNNRLQTFHKKVLILTKYNIYILTLVGASDVASEILGGGWEVLFSSGLFCVSSPI